MLQYKFNMALIENRNYLRTKVEGHVCRKSDMQADKQTDGQRKEMKKMQDCRSSRLTLKEVKSP